jgi:hypothetical protein
MHLESLKLKDKNKKQLKLVDLGNKREDFLKDVTRLMVATNIPLSKVNHVEFVSFMEKYAQQRAIDRTTLTKRLLPQCADDVNIIQNKFICI